MDLPCLFRKLLSCRSYKTIYPISEQTPWYIFCGECRKKYRDQFVTRLPPVKSFRRTVLNRNRQALGHSALGMNWIIKQVSQTHGTIIETNLKPPKVFIFIFFFKWECYLALTKNDVIKVCDRFEYYFFSTTSFCLCSVGSTRVDFEWLLPFQWYCMGTAAIGAGNPSLLLCSS